MNLFDQTPIKIMIGCLGFLAVAGFAADVFDYLNTEREASRHMEQLQLNEKLVEAAQLNRMIRDLHESRAADADEFMNWKLAYDLTAIRYMAADAGEKDQSVVRRVVNTIAHDQHAHPNYYLAAAPATHSDVQ